MKILIIEDNESYSFQLKIKLEHSGFDTQIESTCDSGFSYFQKNQFNIDAILLDVNFEKKGEGLKLLKEIKNISNVWVGIMSQEFTCKDNADSLGCDAFYSKTLIDVDRLIDSLLILIECKSIPKSDGMCKFKLTNDQFYINDKPLSIEGKEFDILKLLYEQKDKDKPLSLFDIEEELNVSHASIPVHITSIRKKLPDNCKKLIIKTVHSRGYICPYPKDN